MEFWIGLNCICFLCMGLNKFLPASIYRIVPYVLMFILWFITAFRYRIGWDYESYANLFYLVEIGNIRPEITFIYLCDWLRSNGFDYQSIFIVYSLCSYTFVWLGISYYTKSSYQRVIALVLFVFMSFQWFSFSGVRQFLAIAICFYAGKYILQHNMIKFILFTLFAFLWHNSAIVFLPFYWIARRRFKRIYLIIGLIFSAIFSLSGGILLVLQYLIPYLGFYETYILDFISASFSSGIGLIFWNGVFLLSLLHKDEFKSEVENMILNLYWIGLLFVFLLNFSTDIYRIKVYFEIFGIMFYSNLILKLNFMYKTKFFYGILILMCIFNLNTTYKSSLNEAAQKSHAYSADNINYEFNFNVLQKK